jgi:hypothetical protein
MVQSKVNWFGVAGGVSVFCLIVVSFFVPWWQLVVGDNLMTTSVSPLNTNFDLFGNAISVPLIVALNIAGLISLSAGGILMLVYSVRPLGVYSSRLLGFSYKKPLYSVVFFLAGLIVTVAVVGSLFSISVPLFGSQISTLPAEYTEGVTLRILMNAGFQWPFLLAITAAGLCIGAKVYHQKVIEPKPKKRKLEVSKTIQPITVTVQ